MTPRWSSSSRDSTSHGSATTPSSCPWAPGIAMTEALLAVLQFADGLFPSGGFAHSFGLETYAQTGAIRDASGVGEFLRAQLEGSTGPADAVAAACAVRRARETDLAGSVEIGLPRPPHRARGGDRKSARLKPRHANNPYAVLRPKKKVVDDDHVRGAARVRD